MGDLAAMVRRIIPLPKRSLRSIIALVLFILTPILLIHRLASGVGASGTRHSLSLPEIVLSLQRRINSAPIPGTGAHQWRKKTQNVFHADTSNDEDDRPAKKPSKAPMPPTKSDHKYLRNGLLVPNPHAQHPIYDLITRSNQAWETKLERASKTLDQAVKEYRRRYGRNPPRGFDRWWDWAQKHNIKLPDEYDQIVSGRGGDARGGGQPLTGTARGPRAVLGHPIRRAPQTSHRGLGAPGNVHHHVSRVAVQSWAPRVQVHAQREGARQGPRPP